MSRGKKGIDNLNETLSKETPEVKEKLLEEIIKPEDNQDNKDEHVSNENKEMNNLSNEEQNDNMDEHVSTVELCIGDRVKIKKGIDTDSLGRRIHAGLQNYTYTIRSIRPDRIACIECLTHVFNVKIKDLELVK